MKEFDENFEEDEEPIDTDAILKYLAQSEIEATERNARWNKMEEDGIKETVKYFDRIHDYLSNYNNLMVGAFFALAQFQKNISRWTIIIPIVNLGVLIYINYRMMNKSRFESDITNKDLSLLPQEEKKLRNTNLFSLLAIISTAIVTICFLYYLATY